MLESVVEIFQESPSHLVIQEEIHQAVPVEELVHLARNILVTNIQFLEKQRQSINPRTIEQVSNVMHLSRVEVDQSQ